MKIQTAPAFTWNSAINRYVGPAQKTTMENKITEAAKQEEEKHVCCLLFVAGMDCADVCNVCVLFETGSLESF